MVMDLMADGYKRDSLADRAESLLLCLKHRFPGLTQTALDISKIQHKDVGKSTPGVFPRETGIRRRLVVVPMGR
ncbi:hypothetical protein L1987_00666 [Smallanthus sonchifolius]|uniref:Uncharacterized protein n=1 Tax=Smallanthus sonchifolius TaxID=185202 RepID=A0ACB9K2Y7_9ASTR|nr:hypothetical protein L1987_00666 [Smallanthus sonchifolius]